MFLEVLLLSLDDGAGCGLLGSWNGLVNNFFLSQVCGLSVSDQSSLDVMESTTNL